MYFLLNFGFLNFAFATLILLFNCFVEILIHNTLIKYEASPKHLPLKNCYVCI